MSVSGIKRVGEMSRMEKMWQVMGNVGKVWERRANKSKEVARARFWKRRHG